MAKRDIVVIGASAGGVEALKEFTARLPSDFPGAVFVVLHVPSHGTSVLPRILSRSGPLPAIHPQDGQIIHHGQIYVGPPDYHLLLKRGYVTLAHGPRENGHRPAIDPLFRAAARTYGARVIGVVLSGVLDDGTAGLLAIKSRGGIAVVQDPGDALYSGMPRSAIENVDVDHVVPIIALAELLTQLVQEDVTEEERPVSEEMENEVDILELNKPTLEDENKFGIPSVFACPECGGTLWEVEEGDLIRFRCRVGHAYSAQSLLAHQEEGLEEAFWIALRALEESASLSQRLAERARSRGHATSAVRFEEQERDARARADIIRKVLLDGNPANTNDTLSDDAELGSDAQTGT